MLPELMPISHVYGLKMAKGNDAMQISNKVPSKTVAPRIAARPVEARTDLWVTTVQLPTWLN